MQARRKYVKRAGLAVAAVQLALETDGFTYRKWGGVQTCKAGDWIVDNAGDVYTVDRATFERTYRQSGTGAYVKTTAVWAEAAREAGSVRTKEGETHYQAGDYLVFNEEQGGDGYAVTAGKFEAMYEPAD
jgi:hypothetical protein